MTLVYNIPLSSPFIDSLANFILDNYRNDPKAVVIVPNQHYAKSLLSAFISLQTKDSFIFPKIEVLNDLEANKYLVDIPNNPTILSSLQQKLLLSNLVAQWARNKEGISLTLSQTHNIGEELAKFLNILEAEQAPICDLKNLVPNEFAKQWKITLDLLELIIDVWPKLLNDKNLISKEQYLNLIIQEKIKTIENNSSPSPIIIAGFDNYTTPIKNLLKAISNKINGIIFINGLDYFISDGMWEELHEDNAQFHNKKLLNLLNINRNQVINLPYSNIDKEKIASLLNYSAENSTYWQNIDNISSKAIDGLEYIQTSSATEEAQVIALMIKKILLTNNQTCSLVTQNKTLAAKVITSLNKLGVPAEQTWNKPIRNSSCAIFLKLILSLTSNYTTKDLLALLKHEYCCLGHEKHKFNNIIYNLEKDYLRKRNFPNGIKDILVLLKKDNYPHLDFIEKLDFLIDKFLLIGKNHALSIEQLITSHVNFAQELANTSDQNPQKYDISPFHSEAGVAILNELNSLANSTYLFSYVKWGDYITIFDSLVNNISYCSNKNNLPRLTILSPEEAKILKRDLIIISDVNEESIPSICGINPWLNEQMTKKLGILTNAQNIALQAKTFANLIAQPNVIITRSIKNGGAQTISSRFLIKLEIILKKLNLHEKIVSTKSWQDWLKIINHIEILDSITPPAPTPPIEARPKKLSVTNIELLLRNPYGFYAKNILGLYKLETLDYVPSVAELGNIVHKCLDDFIKNYASLEENNQLNYLLSIIKYELDQYVINPITYNFWWSRLNKIAKWFVDNEKKRRQSPLLVFTEQQGYIEIIDTIVTAKADRIEVKDNCVSIIDYKTGTPPTDKEISLGISPQIILEGLILRNGKFNEPKITSNQIYSLEFWQLKGNIDEPASIKNADSNKSNINNLIDQANEGIHNLINYFNDPQAKYLSTPDPKIKPKYNDYEHLARNKEWGA